MGRDWVKLGRRSLLRGTVGLAAGIVAPGGVQVAKGQAQLPDNLLLVADQRPAYGGEPRRGGTLRMIRPTESPNDFNPASFRMDYQVPASYLESLVRPDDVTMEPSPGLAESWDVGRDGREITYRLREGVRWHDGTPLTGDDVAFSYEVYRDDVNSSVVNLLALLERVETVNERTIRVRLLDNDPTWLFNASSLPIIQSAQYRPFWEEMPDGARSLVDFDWRANRPVGTGPWRITDWGGRGVSFERNQEYWGQPAWMDRFELRWEAGEQRRLEAWRDGEVDLLWPVPAGGLGSLGARPARLFAADAAQVMFAAYNFDNPASPIAGALDDLALRRALSLAVDRRALGDEVFGGFTQPFAVGTVAQPWAHDDSLRAPRIDRAEAASLLEAAGWFDYNGDGVLERNDGVPLSLNAIFLANGSGDLARVLARIKLDLATLGIDLQLEPLSPPAFEDRWRVTRDYDLIAYAYDLFPGFTDYDLYGSRWDIRRNAFGWNPGGYADPDVDEAIEAYLASPTIEGQRQALLQLQQAAADDPFGLWLGFPGDQVLVATDILGFQPSKFWQTANAAALWRTGT